MMIYVCNPDAYEFEPRFDFGPRAVVVELGAGTGAAGLAIAAAHPHARVVLTDLPEVCPLLQANAQGYPGVEVRLLSWGCATHAQALRDKLALTPVSHVICSDLVCRELSCSFLSFFSPYTSVFPRVVGTAASLVAAPHRSERNFAGSVSASGPLVQDPVAVQRNAVLVCVRPLVHVRPCADALGE